MRVVVLLWLFVVAVFAGQAQQITPEEYIRQYKDVAISEMKRMGVPAAITLAQGILESENGNSELVKKSNNHFGIKCKNTWTGATVYHDDDAAGECFRSYQTAEESFRDHSNFLRGNSRYGFLFQLDAMDYKGWAYGLKKAGYATNPQYPNILIRNIEQYNLQQYSLAALSDLPNFDASKYNTENPAITIVNNPGQSPKDSSAQKSQEDFFKDITVNGSRCILAPQRTSLLAIATRYHIDLPRLLEYNDLKTDGLLQQSQLVFLQKKSKTGEKDFYIVQEGETLYEIAQKTGVQLQYLLDYNRLTESAVPAAGTKIWLVPGKADAKPAVKMHTVAPHEGLYAIARRYNVTVQQLREWNQLKSDALKPGQQLIVAKQ